jgi:hypothetical protein
LATAWGAEFGREPGGGHYEQTVSEDCWELDECARISAAGDECAE